ncbi:MAG: AMP-binding protein [Acidobacteria bacterium]|nr:AMP-binding protein [Acidobacteriota bacterium]
MIHADLLGDRARITPDKTALVEVATGRRLAYRELDERARRMARVWVEALELAVGERVAILSHNRTEYLEAFFATAKSGVILVTLGTRLTAPELAGILDDCGAAVVLVEASMPVVDELRRQRPALRFVSLDAGAAGGDGDCLPALAAGLGRDEGALTGRRAGPEDVSCLLYTSGTTGKPKGVMIPHRMVIWNGYNTVANWQLEESDVSPIFTPLYHAGGLMAFAVPLVTIGGTMVLHRGFDAAEVWRTFEAEGCTVVLGVPAIWKMLMEDPAFATTDLSRVRWFISGGAPLPEYLIEAYNRRGVVFKQGFGMTEVGVNCFAMTVEDSYAKKGSIGKPMMLTEVRLVDGEGRDVEAGEVGEMLFRGQHVCVGYWNAPEATAAALDADGWFHSGDLARRDEDGFFYIAGRRKEMFISGGVNVFPAEIESALLLHPAVEDAAVVGIEDERWGEVGVAFVVRRGQVEHAAEDAAEHAAVDGAELEAELVRHLGERLARYKIPKGWRFLSELPRTAYGKVVKGDLKTLYREDTP